MTQLVRITDTTYLNPEFVAAIIEGQASARIVLSGAPMVEIHGTTPREVAEMLGMVH